MKIFNLLLLIIITLYSTFSSATLLVPTPPLISAKNYILQDFKTGKILMEKNIDEVIEPASLTKLMTAYIVFQKLKIGDIKLDALVYISENAQYSSENTSRMFLEAHTKVSVELLLKGMIIQSGNDASIALAEFIGGSETTFASLMNEQAKQFNLKNTHYMNSTGLPAKGHYSSTRDIARIAYFLIRQFPEYYRWYSQDKMTYNNITQENRNTLLQHDPSVDGIKTGYTDDAGYCLAVSAKRSNMRLISIIMGTASNKLRISGTQKMLNYGFSFFDTYFLYEATKALDIEKIWYGQSTQLSLGLENNLYITIAKKQYNYLQATAYIDKHIMAPVNAGQKYGTLKLFMGNQLILERSLIALNSIEEASLWKRLMDYFSLFFH
ncbi:MAG: D-alanyl-D-alanine carboxypeptidase [Thiomargarita sp.]|nr:D-alanyl-D-alanine carboxypeptidase [Thiomargarita sp.]